MRYQITAVHVEPVQSKNHEHITHLYVELAGSPLGGYPKSEIVQLLENKNITAFVDSPQGPTEVVVVAGTPKYLRTIRNNMYTDNLLNLPRF